MCGIAGCIHFDGTPAKVEVIKRMTDAIAHRGPDGEGVYLSGSVALGHRRLAIIDLSTAGKQPLSNEDETIWVTFNGEIYNFLEIRRELLKLGHKFQSQTDTEVIVHAYEEWGTECLHRFNGMFAFVLWDERKGCLWLVRDRLGIKPLFYAYSSQGLVFGSEIKAILRHPYLERKIDYEALAYYLALNYTPAPYTLFADIRQLLPGHYLIVDAVGSVQEVEYWELTYSEEGQGSEQSYLEEFNSLLADAINLRLVSDVPFGAFLSGGVDSSSIAYWMSRQMSEPVKTFSIGFNESSFNELGYARQVAQHIQAEHYEQIVKADAAEILPQLVWHAEEPTADSSMVAVYYLAQMARQQVTMVLAGDGADEILAGYETYQAYYLHRLYQFIPAWLRKKAIAPLINRLPVSDAKVSWDFKLKRFVAGGELSAEDAHASWRMIFNAEARQELLSPVANRPGVGADVLELYRHTFARTNACHPLNRLLYVDTRFYLPNDMLVKTDRMTMAHGLEAREPYLDHRLVEFAASVPPNLKLKHWRQKKYLLKASMGGKLPSDILWRKKQGFNLPNSRWLKRELKVLFTDILSAKHLQEMEILDQQAVAKLLDDHFQDKADNSHQIWCIMTLALWWQQFFTKEGNPITNK
ncbi:MAG: asparagine synthase (glutamine-hydrolyzing) [Symploca sp. SIO2D2]|nr:asparagine synthase (glutamine-hydrolyzing) [Symploca sp. SIO2D2]